MIVVVVSHPQLQHLGKRDRVVPFALEIVTRLPLPDPHGVGCKTDGHQRVHGDRLGQTVIFTVVRVLIAFAMIMPGVTLSGSRNPVSVLHIVDGKTRESRIADQ